MDSYHEWNDRDKFFDPSNSEYSGHASRGLSSPPFLLNGQRGDISPPGAWSESLSDDPRPLPSSSSNSSPAPLAGHSPSSSARDSSRRECFFSPSPNVPTSMPTTRQSSRPQRTYAEQPNVCHITKDPFPPLEVDELTRKLEQAFKEQQAGDVPTPASPTLGRPNQVSEPGLYAPSTKALGKQPMKFPEACDLDKEKQTRAIDTSDAESQERPIESARRAYRNTNDKRARRGFSVQALTYPYFSTDTFWSPKFGWDAYMPSRQRAAASPNADNIANAASRPASIFGGGPASVKSERVLKSARKPNEHSEQSHDDIASDNIDEDECGVVNGDKEDDSDNEDSDSNEVSDSDEDSDENSDEDSDEVDEDENEDEYSDENSEEEAIDASFEDVNLSSDSDWEQVGKEEEPWDLVEQPGRSAIPARPSRRSVR